MRGSEGTKRVLRGYYTVTLLKRFNDCSVKEDYLQIDAFQIKLSLLKAFKNPSQEEIFFLGQNKNSPTFTLINHWLKSYNESQVFVFFFRFFFLSYLTFICSMIFMFTSLFIIWAPLTRLPFVYFYIWESFYMYFHYSYWEICPIRKRKKKGKLTVTLKKKSHCAKLWINKRTLFPTKKFQRFKTDWLMS